MGHWTVAATVSEQRSYSRRSIAVARFCKDPAVHAGCAVVSWRVLHALCEEHNCLILFQSHEFLFLQISFGSGFWPSSLEGLEAFVDVLLEKNVPFVSTASCAYTHPLTWALYPQILSQGSPFAKLTDSLTAKIKKSGLGLTTRWAPQQTILAHPVLGWFVTHCGLGSILEAISSGVPM